MVIGAGGAGVKDKLSMEPTSFAHPIPAVMSNNVAFHYNVFDRRGPTTRYHNTAGVRLPVSCGWPMP
jgi:hypothetical protein